MATPYRGYTEVPGAVTPDVPYRVNLALREVDADVQDLETSLRETDTAHGGRLAALEVAAGFGSGMQLQDEAVNGLLNSTTSATGATARRLANTLGPAATVTALGTEGTPTQAAFERFTLGHLADTFHGPMKEWGAALGNAKTRAAIWVNLGSSTANGGTTTYAGQAWAPRIATWLTGRSMLDSAALPRLEGVTARPATGIHAYSGAVGGTTSNNYLDAAKMAAITALQPDLVTHMVGSNDYGSGIALTTYKSRLRNWLDQLTAATPNTVHLLIHQQPRNDIQTPAYAWSEYGKAMAEVADLYENAAFFDASVYFPRAGMPGHIMTEAVHMNAQGHKILADAVAEAMGTPIYYVRDSITPTWTGKNPAAGTEGEEVFRQEIKPAPYPRRITVDMNVYAYGTNTNHAAMGAEMGLRCGYVNDKDNSIPAGPLYQFRVAQGGQNYARTYGASKSYHIDANRTAWVWFLAGGSCYVSGTTTYTDFNIRAEEA